MPDAANSAFGVSKYTRDFIVCIDDLERKGGNLPMKDVLGLISYLRDPRSRPR